MSWPPISQGLCLAALAVAAARAQTIGAGARAVVASDTLPVFASMSESAQPKLTLKRGEQVVIGMVLFGSETTWCAISRVGETKRLGYASCESLEPAASSGAAAPPPKPAPPPVIREVPQAPIVVHELAPAPIVPPAGAAAPAAPPPAPVAPAAAPTPTTPAPAAALPAPTPPSPSPASPEASAPPVKENGDFAETLLASSALGAELDRYTRMTRISAFLDKGRLAEIDAEALERVLAGQFRPAPFEEAIRAQFVKGYSPEQLPALADWVRSATAVKLSGLEQRADSPASRQALVDFAGSLTQTPPPEARLLLIHRIYDASRICDTEVETTIALVYTTADAIGPALPKEKQYGPNELDRALGTVKSRYRAVMMNATIVRYLFAFQSASGEELEQYAAFLESDGGKWLTAAIDKGFFDATESISRRLREEIPRLVKARQH